MPITFVYRSHYAGILGKHVKRFDDASVLAWFQRVWKLAAGAKSPDKALAKELGVHVYGFGSLFEAAKENDLPPPGSVDELTEHVDEHLYLEGEARIDEHSFRASTNDDEVELAYFLFDDAAPLDRVEYLLTPTFPLPSRATNDGRAYACPVETSVLGPAAKGAGRTYAVLLTFSDSESIPTSPPWVFEGVRLPDLVQHLRDVQPDVAGDEDDDYPETWPFELRLLRAAIQPEDRDLRGALERVARYPFMDAGGGEGSGRVGLGPQPAAWAEFEELAGGGKPEGAKKSVVDVADHVAQLAAHQSNAFGFQQIYLFDDVWAASNDALASSLLRYASGWDPFTDGEDEDDDDGEDDEDDDD